MTGSFMRCWKSISLALMLLAWLGAGMASVANAAGIEPQRASLNPGEDGWSLSAEFGIDLGPHLEDAVTRGVPLYFSLEVVVDRLRKYWFNEHVMTRTLAYRLSYNNLTRQYRLSAGALHQNFDSLPEVLRVLGRVSALPVVERGVLKSGETYGAAVRLILDQTQLPKPLQLDAIANRDWAVETRTLRWQFVAPRETAAADK